MKNKTPSDFKTFKKRFPNMVSVLNSIIASEPLGNHRKDLDLDLEAIFKMVASSDKKINGELIAANYLVEKLKRIGVTEQMVSQLEKDVPKIIDKVKTPPMNSASATARQIGGQPHRVLSIWIVILLSIIDYLLLEIRLSSDDIAGIQNTLNMEQTRLQELNRNCPLPLEYLEYDDPCHVNTRRIATYNWTLLGILRGDVNHQLLISPFAPHLYIPDGPPMPMLTIVVGIVCIMRIGAMITLPVIAATTYYSQGALLQQQQQQQPHSPPSPRIDSAIPRVRPLDIHPDDDDNIPEHFLDPIFREFMTDPVVAIDGQTYDRDSIVRNFELRGASPMTGAPIVGVEQQVLIPNLTLREQMTTWWEENQRKKAAAAAAAAAASRNTAASSIQRAFRARLTRTRTRTAPKKTGGGRKCKCKRMQSNRHRCRTQTKRRNK